MKIAGNLKSFREAWSRVAPLAQRRTPKPILQNVLLACKDGKLSLSATDLSSWIQLELDSDIAADEDGAVLLSSFRVGQIAAVAAGDELNIEVLSQSVCIRTGMGKHDLTTAKTEEFPSPPGDAKPLFAIPGFSLSCAIGRVVSAADDGSNARYAMKSVRLEVSNGWATSVALDTCGMCYYEAGNATGEDAELMLPRDEAIRLSRLLREETGICEVGLFGDAASFQCGRLRFTTCQVAGRYPKWRDSIPKTNCHVSLSSEAFEGSLREAASHSSMESLGVDFDTLDGNLLLQGRNKEDGGVGVVRLPVSCEASIRTAFNPAYILDFLKSCDPSQPLSMHFRINKSDGAFKFNSGENHFLVIMPLSRNS